MPTLPFPRSRRAVLVLVLALLVVAAAIALAAVLTTGRARAGSIFTQQLTLMGYEGIATVGSNLTSHATRPPAGDYATTHCQYVDVQNTTVGQYYLRYPLHLPDGVTLTQVDLFVADFNPSGVMWIYLRSRPWDSREAGDTLGFTLTDDVTNNDRLITMTPSGGVEIDNATTQYWIDISPVNGTDPGQLCVYSLQVSYTVNGVLLPFIQK